MTDPAQTAAPATRRGLLKTIAALGVAGLTGTPIARANAPALTRVALIAP
ncbi:twin-arginine translocation signal domain-containing protein, partial [Deinococcus sp. 23YEL01]|nr:twin-arginine translocation signal domain-containing protein [Deinococcus sp. 23YEL01]